VRLVKLAITISLMFYLMLQTVNAVSRYSPVEAVRQLKAALDLQQIADAIELEHMTNDRWPTDIRKFINENFTTRISKGDLSLDPWGKPYGYTITESWFAVYSTGRDGVKGTPDDIVVRRYKTPHRGLENRNPPVRRKTTHPQGRRLKYHPPTKKVYR